MTKTTTKRSRRRSDGARAARAKPKTRRRARPAAPSAAAPADLAAMTHQQLWDTWNALVPEAISAGLKAKAHTSAFETKAGGVKQITKLKEAIKAAAKS